MDASARVTSSFDTPTRKPPPISFTNRKRSRHVSSSQYENRAARIVPGSAPRKGPMRSSIHTARPTSLWRPGCGRMWAMVSAMSPTAAYDSSNSQSSRPAYSMAYWRSSLLGTAWRGLPPARKYTAQAAFSGAALAK